MSNIALFPIQKSNAAFARHGKELQKHNVLPVLAPAHITMAGMDLSEIDGGSNTGIALRSDLITVLDECDILYLDYSNFVFRDEDYYRYIELAKKKGIHVYYSREIADRLKINTKQQYDEKTEKTEADNSIKDLIKIEAPIISVFTMGNENDQGNVELEIRKYFIGKGYKVSQIGINEYSRLLGFHVAPSFLFANNIDGKTKRLLFNRYVRKIIKEEKPDLLIIGVPEAIMKFNEKILAGMGDVPCIVQDAVDSDIGVICTCYEPYTEDYFRELSLFSRYRLNCEARYFNISNSMIINDPDNEGRLEHLNLDNSFVMANMDFGLKDDAEFEVFNSFTEASILKALNKMENELLSNPGF